MSRGIPISKEFGVNPTIPKCFYCGEARNEVALLGTQYKGPDGRTAQAPMHLVIDFEPCDACKTKYEGFVLLVELSNEPSKYEKPKPTGNFGAIKYEAAAKVFDIPLTKKIAYVQIGVLAKLATMVEKAEGRTP